MTPGGSHHDRGPPMATMLRHLTSIFHDERATVGRFRAWVDSCRSGTNDLVHTALARLFSTYMDHSSAHASLDTGGFCLTTQSAVDTLRQG